MQPSVFFALIVRNEEAKLPGCLESIAGIADEIIVVDTGSTDRTKDVAAGFGAKVFDFSWVDDFAAARNECIRHASGEWIFWLDADERIDEENRAKLRRLFLNLTAECAESAEKNVIHEGTRIDTNKKTTAEEAENASNVPHSSLITHHSSLLNAAFVMKCLCVDASGGQNGPHGTVVDHVRLFRNRPENRWKYRVHEQILPALKTTGTEIRWTDIVIHHVGYQDPAFTRQKLERNLRLLHLDHAEHPDDPYILFNLGWAYLELGRVPEGLSFLHRSLQLSHPADSIVKKIYALLIQAHSRLGQRNEALAACRAGRARCPGDPELLYLEGQLLRETGQVDAAIGCFRRLVSCQEMNRGVRGERGDDNDPRINTNGHEDRKEKNHGEHGEHGGSNEFSSLITHHSSLRNSAASRSASPATWPGINWPISTTARECPPRRRRNGAGLSTNGRIFCPPGWDSASYSSMRADWKNWTRLLSKS